MNKKPYNEIEEQIKAAASQWEPDWDEHAWKQMEAMLNKDDEHKKPLAWWKFLLPLILAGGLLTFYMLKWESPTKQMPSQHSNNKKPGIVINKQEAKTANSIQRLKENSTPQSADKLAKNPTSKHKVAAANVMSHKNAAINFTGNPSNHASNSLVTSTANKQYTKAKANIQILAPAALDGSMLHPVSATTQTDSMPPAAASVKTSPVQETISQQDSIIKTDTDSTAHLSHSKNQNAIPTHLPDSGKPKSQFKNSGFYLSLHAGAEGNGTRFPGLNKISARAGLVVGYFISPHWSINTGIFAGNKKYIAGPNDYKAKPGSYWSTVQITKVDANCRVFEIPLSVQYHFTASTHHKSYAGLGLSSFIMDKEDYHYNYIRYNNPYYASARYKGNKHWFSVLRLYAGLQKNIAPNILLSVQPGLAIPLAGVGEGQIKLYSSELLLGIQYRLGKKQ